MWRSHNEVNPCGFMKYPDEYEVAYAMKYALRHIKDLLYFTFIKDKYFIIEDYFILRSNISLFIPTNSNLTTYWLFCKFVLEKENSGRIFSLAIFRLF